MPFGLSGAPATFQRMMDQLTNDKEFAAAYMDDLVVYSNTWEEHLQHLQATLQRLQTARLTAKPRNVSLPVLSVPIWDTLMEEDK